MYVFSVLTYERIEENVLGRVMSTNFQYALAIYICRETRPCLLYVFHGHTFNSQNEIIKPEMSLYKSIILPAFSSE